MKMGTTLLVALSLVHLGCGGAKGPGTAGGEGSTPANTGGNTDTVGTGEGAASGPSGSDAPGGPAADSPAKPPGASEYRDKRVWSYSGGDSPLPWSMFRPNDFASIPVHFDGAGVRPVGSVPPPGVHPRMFFSAGDLPAIRKRLKETRAGREAWKNVLAYANALKLTYDEKADYAKPDWMNGGFGVHGRVPLFRIGGYGKREDYYAELVKGRKPAKPFPFFEAGAVEALRCVIEDDAEGAKALAKATVSAVRFEQERRQKEDKPVKPGQPPNPSTGRLPAIGLGMIYDFIYQWMDPAQREAVHDELVTLSAWHDNYGTFNNADTSRSNWATFSYWVFDLLAIEGEPGFNDLKFRGLYRGWRNFLTASYFQSGAVFEGEGKSLLGMDAIVAFDRLAAKYGLEPLSHHPVIRRHLGNFTACSMLPTRDSFVCFDILGAMGRDVCTPVDVVVAKYLNPDDKRIDLVYRAVVGEDYRKLPDRVEHLWNGVVLSALFATDYDPGNSPASQGLPLSFFCGQRAVMMTRSSWENDATFLTMHVRGASGGHPYRDRNGIMLASLGRPWVTIPGHGGEDNGWMCSTVLINGCDQSATTPGRAVDYVDTPSATFLVGDSRYCWDWVWKTARKGDGKLPTRDEVEQGKVDTGAAWSLVDQSFNDFAFTRQDAAAYNRPLKFSPDWLAPDGMLSPVVRQVNNPVLRSFRTAGLVRGAHPYVLVVDDVERNALPCVYEWHLTLCDDVAEVKKPVPHAQASDLVLAGAKGLGPRGELKAGEAALLVRVLDAKGKPSVRVGVVNERKEPAGDKDKTKVNLLTLSTRAAAPDFKVLIYPFRGGEALPGTSWNKEHDRLTLTSGAERDLIAFSPAASGKTDVTITRNGQPVVAVNRPTPALNDPGSEGLSQKLKSIPEKAAALGKFDPEALPGLVASWSFDAVKNGTYPAHQRGVPGIPAAGTTAGPGVVGSAAGVPSAGVFVPLKLPKSPDRGITFAFWVKSQARPWMGTVIDVNSSNGFSLSLVQGTLRFDTQHKWANGGGLSSSLLTGWTHYAVASDGRTEVVYCNGAPLLTLPVASKLSFGDGFRLAGGGYGGFAGAYDDLRVYNRALDADTVEKIYLKRLLMQTAEK